MSLTLKTDDFKSGTKADVNRHGAANRLKLEKKVLVNNKIKASGKKKYKTLQTIQVSHGNLLGSRAFKIDNSFEFFARVL